MNTWRWFRMLASFLGLLSLTACIPEKNRVIWSPNGSQALALLPDGLHLCTPAGQLSPVLVKGATYAEWLPDSQHIMVLRDEAVTTWDQLTKLTSPATQKTIIELAEEIRNSALAYEGDWDKFTDTLKNSIDINKLNFYGTAIMIYFQNQNDPALKKKMGTHWEEWSKLAQAPTTVLQTYQVKADTLEPGTILFQSAFDKSIRHFRLSPTGTHLAVSYITDTYAISHPQMPPMLSSNSLGVITVEHPETLQEIATNTAWYVDWTKDGQYLVFARTNEPDITSEDSQGDAALNQMRLGQISQHRITNLGEKPASEYKNEDLARIFYHPLDKVRCLKDGRILFASHEYQLPTTKDNDAPRCTLFVIDAKTNAITNLLPEATNPTIKDLMPYFEVSPDEQYLSLLNGDGYVQVLNLTTHQITDCQTKSVPGQQGDNNSTPKPRIIPQWRNAHQLTYVAPIKDSKPDQPSFEVVLKDFSTNQTISLSADWPATSVQGFLLADPNAGNSLTNPKVTTIPTTQP